MLPEYEVHIQKANHIIPTPQSLHYTEMAFIDLNDFHPEGISDWKSEICKLFHFGSGETSRKFLLDFDQAMSEEEYRISISSLSASVTAGGSRGMQYALQTLRQMKIGNYLPFAEISDKPALSIRGMHVSFGSMQQLDFQDALSIISKLEKFKLNTFTPEYRGRFPSVRCAAANGADQFSEAEIRQIDQACMEKQIEVIPHIQSLGHMRHILRHPDYSRYKENQDSPEQICPLDPDSFTLFTDLAEELLALHPEGRFLHVGGDETYDLGKCPKCAEFVRKYGKGELYLQRIQKVCDWVLAHGRRPIIWDDMLSAHPEIAQKLDRRVIIMYWDYWTTNRRRNPLFIARMRHGKDLIYDKSYLNADRLAALPDPERGVMEHFIKWPPTEAADVASEAEQGIYGALLPYLGKELPYYFNGFPYLDYYRDLGFDVIGAPSALGNNFDDLYGVPNIGRARANIREFAAKCKEKDAMGLVTTSWYNFPAEWIDLSILETGHHSWRTES